MKSHQTLQGLDWVAGEVEASLAAACDALKHFLAHQDEPSLSRCLELFHQVHGCLKIIEADSGALLVEEMEQVVDALRDGTQGNAPEACEALVQAIGIMPSYLARLQAGQADHPAPLVATLNDLRALRGQRLFSESAVFAPDLSLVESASGSLAVGNEADFRKGMKKLRQAYQAALLGLLRDRTQDSHYVNIKKAVARLAELSAATSREQLWRAATVFLDGLHARTIPWGSAARALLRELEREIRGYVDQGSQAFTAPFPRDLLVNLLFYASSYRLDSPMAQALRGDFRLDMAWPDGYGEGREPSLDSDLVVALGDGLRQELETVKERLEEFMASERGDMAPLAAVAATLGRMADTLAMANQLDLQQGCQSVARYIGELASASAADLEKLAASIVDIEAGILAWRAAASGQDASLNPSMAVSGAFLQLLEETGRELQAIKDAVLGALKTGEESDSSGGPGAEPSSSLTSAPGAARRLATVLRLADLERGAAIVDGLGHALENMAAGGSAAWRHLDALADAIMAVEHYLENCRDGRPRDDESLLGLAELALARLGQSPARQAASKAAAQRAPEEPVAEEPTALEAAEDDIDPEIREIFVEEAREVLASLETTFPAWAADPGNREALGETRRAFHTLKGSGRMVGASAIGELAWAQENLLNRVIEGRLASGPAQVGCVQEAIALLPDMVSAFEQGRRGIKGEQVAALTELAQRLADGETPDMAAVPLAAAVGDEDRQLQEIFSREARTHLAVVSQFVAAQRTKAPFHDHPTAVMQGALHTLKGSAHMASIEPVAELVTPLERFMRDMLNYQLPVDGDILDLLADSITFCERIIAALDAGDAVAAGEDADEARELQARLGELRQRALAMAEGREASLLPAVDPAFLQMLMADGMQRVLDIEQTLQQWRSSQRFDHSIFAAVARELTELQVSAEKAGYAPLATLAGQVATSYGHMVAKRIAPSDGLVNTLAQAHDTLLNMVDAVAAHQEMAPPPDSLPQALLAIEFAATEQDALREALAQRLADLSLPGDSDSDIVELFFGEADELLEAMEHAFHDWRQSPADRNQPESLKRSLHTFKGGARMAGITALGEISHDLESEVVSREEEVIAGDVDAISAMLLYHDALNSGVDRLRKAFRDAPARKPAPQAPQVQAPPPAQSEPGAGQPSAQVIPFAGSSRGLDSVGADVAKQVDAVQEMVRVAAPVLDLLVNLAGETSISRGQVEQHISEFMFSLDEMEATIRRMHDQVRRLGIETDAQVMFRREQIESSDSTEGFDPLEMDRYSQLQQLSRSLLESASDLQDLRETLVDKARDAESLLLQQSRINTDLQEGLMRTRMVPFSRMVPRLRRIVRQVSATLGKQVNLHLESIEGEMDRTILERIVPSLEHMIRNAVDHGIESAEQRRALGKPEEGTLSLSLAREGADILIRLADDGRGLDVDAIRAKAVASGLMAENAVLSDHEIQQYIFSPGFTTSSEVTQVSGRGVGMDVVNSDVRQLGGAISILSQRGAGTEFTVRLPFTVSVNRALMIEVGEDSYALPLNSISGVTRIAVDDLTRYYQNPRERFHYGGEEYQVRYLGSLLSAELRPTLDTALGRQLPVVLVRHEGHQYAVQVDGLIGSREIVVKTLGAQFSQVPGLSGATVLGDGRVVVILDLQALLREQPAVAALAPLTQAPEAEDEEDRIPTVMVVDDSVTVRKVTGRFLEREGYRVITAKDGVDAMRVLQDNTPDVMLLDIEMPRMDGFEVARLVRSTQRLKNLPIVMITSRTGDKHRDRALAMGVDHYLGKPYQEEVLLEAVRQLLDHGRKQLSAGGVGQ